MEAYKVKILDTKYLTHNVKRLKVERPDNYNFTPGQATEVTLTKEGFQDLRNPFTFTGLTDWDHLEFSIKIYNEHHGVTAEIGKLNPGDEIILHDVWGAIQYKGPGIFIAGGAGVTPFIAIIRDLYRKGELAGNKLFFSNKTEEDIILKDEFSKMLGDNFYNTLSKEKTDSYRFGKFDAAFFKEQIKDFSVHFYICGPDKFVEDMNIILEKLGADAELIVFEK